MFENFSSKIKNLFKTKKGSIISTKDLNSLNNGLTREDFQRYKNLIPNILDEFIEENKQNQKRSGSFSSKNNKLTLSEKKLVHSNSGLFLKLKKKRNTQAAVRLSIGRHYFMGKTEESKLSSTKYLRRVSMQENIIMENAEKIEKKDKVKSTNIDLPKRKSKLKRKRTLDPQDTIQANNIQFEFGKIEEKETLEKLEQYQEKMRKTQLRYYVFKKITNYKSSLRKYFQRFRTTVQLMDVIEEKNDDSKESKIEKENKRIKILKNILKNRAYKEKNELNKFFLRFYYNGKYAAGIANLSKIMNKNKKEDNNEVKDENSNINNNVDTNTNNQNINDNNTNILNEMKGDIKKEEEKKELSPEEIEKAKRKRNKELRDLFKNKVRERQKWLHDHFVKFYYKGLLLAMKTGTIRNNTSSSSETKPESTNQVVENQHNSNEKALINKTSSEMDNININKEIKKKEEKTEEEKKEEEDKKNKKLAMNKIRDRSRGLRKLLSEKNKEKTNILRKYFFKFLSNGVLLSLKKTTLRSTKSLRDYEDESENKEEDEKKKKEEEENNWIIEEKKRRKLEEEKRLKELMESRIKILFTIFNRKDQILCGAERNCLQKWDLRAKILSIGDLNVRLRKSKKGKGKKKTKKKEGKNKEKKENENEEQNENK